MTGPARPELVHRVRQRLVAEPGELAAAVRAEAGGILDDAVLSRLQREVAAQLIGAGPLEPLLALDDVTDVLVNGPASVWFDRGSGLERAEAAFADEGAVRALAQRLVAGTGRRLDDAMPYADAVLADGTRLHAVLPPICASTTISLRLFSRRRLTLADLVRLGGVPAPVAEVLRAVVAARLAFAISGGTGTGKTTLLGCLLALVPAGERIVLVEDAPELAVQHDHVVRLVTRAANVEGAGAVGLRELVRQALRMRPDRLVVGEFRGAEMAELLVALNTGHDGGAATLHANSAAAVPARLTALGGLAGLAEATVTGLVASALQVVIHLDRAGGARRVAALGLLLREGDRLVTQLVWSAGLQQPSGHRHPSAGLLAELIQARGVAVPEVLR
ncbi:TadA family conjugal transfer-associated ATPase [Jatrophihabitans sp.]|uniref:TadA family conjugal transfer-associated ATPase n=1 Tax=Jatrophihabitans sp. TaxID=1932789 RepID=UPI0030C6AB66|nr:type secretion system protein [Jatrophihabitans sp.]